MSVGKRADEYTVSVFPKDDIKVYYKEDVFITCKNKPILIGVCDSCRRYRIPLQQRQGQWHPRHPSKKAINALQQSNNVYNIPSTNQAIKLMHVVSCYPVNTTWLKAVKVGNYTGCTLLTIRYVQKYYLETTETPKGHMNQTRKNV